MINLFIDTANNYCNFVLFDSNNKIIDAVYQQTYNNTVDVSVNWLFNLIQKNEIDKLKINNIYVNIGPGSFSNIKVAVNIAKTFTIITHNNLYILSTDYLLSAMDGIVVIDAKSNKSFVSVYNNYKLLMPLQLIDNTQLESIFLKYKSLNVYKDTTVSNEQRIINFFKIIHKCQKIDNVLNLEPLYLKSPL